MFTSSRVSIFAAAILWSLSGLFTKLLSLPGPVIATYRTLVAGIFILFFLKPPFRFEKKQLILVFFFTAMNVSFVSAMTVTTAANAIFLQYTAPLWMSFVCLVFWKERPDRASLSSLLVGMVGIGIIIASEWKTEVLGITLGLLSGVGFAGVALSLRWLRQADPLWLTALEMWGSVLILFPFLLVLYPASTLVPPTPQLGVLLLYGTIQLGIPYVLFARGLRNISPQEAGVILLLEPVLNPVWTFLLHGERPSKMTLVGGTFLLGSLGLRYGLQFAAVKLNREPRT